MEVVEAYNSVAMIQPETLRTIVTYAKGFWISFGPLAGVLVGAWLARSWDKQKWMNDNRKQECQELLAAISHAETLLIGRELLFGTITEKDTKDAYIVSVKTFQSRIFIAKELREQGLFDLWFAAVREFRSQRVVDKLDVEYGRISEKIIEIAMKIR